MYKRFDTSSYSDKIIYGVVEGIYNNGEKTFVQSIEYKYSYSTIEANIKVISDKEDVAIFPADLSEIQEEFSRCEQTTVKQIEDKKTELEKLEKALNTTRQLISGELQKELQKPEYVEISQTDFNLKRKEQEMRRLEDGDNISF